MKLKCCNKCYISKKRNKFNKDKSTEDGYSYYCRECKNSMDKIYRESHKEQMASKKKECYLRKKDYYKARRLDYYNKHKQEISHKRKEKYKNSTEMVTYKCKSCLKERKLRKYSRVSDYCNGCSHRLSHEIKKNGPIQDLEDFFCKIRAGEIKKPKSLPARSHIHVEINGSLYKECTVCKISKKLECFHKKRAYKDGLSYKCKECACEYANLNYRKHHTLKIRDGIKWTVKNKDKVRAYKKKYKDKILSTPKGVIDSRISANMRGDLRKRGSSKDGKTWEALVGYTIDDLYKHLESLFVDGMCWERLSEIHIDHIIPKKFFKYNSYDDPEFRKCWALSNLRPIWDIDNLKKSDYLPNGQRARNLC